MELMEKLRLWGITHAEARHAERDLALQAGGPTGDLRQRAAQLRERADRLHGEVYGELGRRQAAEKPRAA